MESSDNVIFDDDFLKLNCSQVVKSIADNGFFCFAKAVRPEFLERLRREIDAYKPAVNVNNVAPVWYNDQYFFPHAMACSQTYFDYITSNLLRRICQQKFPSEFRLKSHRYYETGYGHSMEWHADNVTNAGVVTNVDGLIFILYVNDVFDGEFQLVTGSYKERKTGSWPYNYTNHYIDENYGTKIKSFAMPAGSIIIYDTYGIHRAKPIVTKGYTRKSIFFQVDADARFAEQILLNPAFFRKTDTELLNYLGFGKGHDFLPNPQSSIKNIPAKHLLRLGAQTASALLYRLKASAIESCLSHDQRMRYARWRKGLRVEMREDTGNKA